jgi:hypothetical protein
VSSYVYYPPQQEGEQVATDQLPKKFEGPENTLLARQQAEREWGSQGELYKLVSPTGLPACFLPTDRPGVSEWPAPK